MRYLFLLLTCTILLSGYSQISDQDKLSVVITSYEARYAGLPDQSWPISSPKRRALVQHRLDSITQVLQTFTKTDLSESDRINLDMLQLIVDDELYQLKFESHLFPLNAEGGFLAGVIYSTQGTRIIDSLSLVKYITKLESLPAYFDSRMSDMQEGIEKGKVSPKLVVQNCIDLIDQFLNTPIEDNFFVQVTQDDLIISQVSIVTTTHVIPAYQKLKSFLKNTYLTAAPEAIGISSITDGKAYYEQRVRYFTTYDITPKEVYNTGLAEVARIKSEMQEIMDELEFKGSFAEFYNFLRTDPQFYCTTPQDLLDRAAWITTKAQGQLPKYFNILPRMPLDVTPVPSALAPNYTGGRYSPGSYKNNRAGQYWVNTYNLPSRPLYVLPALTLHEGVPGHHLQGMLAQEIEDMPSFRRNTYLSAFGEGWGLYAEHLGQEMGIYTTPYEQFGRLTYEMWRACRLVVDPGMHYMGWSREKAYEYMASNTALSIHEVNTEINRYIGWPGQAVSYKMGELKIKGLRKIAEEKLGDKFDIREFHDVLLKNGSVPLQTLEEIITSWIARKKL